MGRTLRTYTALYYAMLLDSPLVLAALRDDHRADFNVPQGGLHIVAAAISVKNFHVAQWMLAYDVVDRGRLQRLLADTTCHDRREVDVFLTAAADVGRYPVLADMLHELVCNIHGKNLAGSMTGV